MSRLLGKAVLEAKSLVRRVFGIPDPWKRFRDLERRIHPDTWACQPGVLAWAAGAAAAEAPDTFEAAADPVVRHGAALRRRLLADFAGRRAGLADRLRVLVHVPDFHVAPTGYSLFRNLGRGLEGLGLPTAYWAEGEPVAPHLDAFRPTLLLSVDHKWYPATQRVPAADVTAVREYRAKTPLLLGFSANHFPEDSAALGEQFAAARAVGVDFFYSFHAEGFVREKYRPFAAAGFRVTSCEFGANPLLFYPVPGADRDLNFVYLAASNFEKWGQVCDYFDRVVREHPGLILGPGWPRAAATLIPDDHMRYLYARARVGLNLHVPFQLAAPTELNERAYNLAACAVPQLTDRPALLPERFGPDSIYAAGSPAEYAALFRHILANPGEARDRGVRSMEAVLARHTVYHRADALVEFVHGEVLRA
jgi:hypothetical protein